MSAPPQDERPVVEPDPAPPRRAPAPVARRRARRSRWLLKIGIEAALVSLGVFLALMGEQWRENAHTRELSQASLRRFRAEIDANRKAVMAVRDYHVTMLKSLEAYAAADPKARSVGSVNIKGLQPVFFDRTAWDLALATQSLAHFDPDIAFTLSWIYGAQQGYADFTRE